VPTAAERLRSPRPTIATPVRRPTAWWREILERRAEHARGEHLDLSQPVEFRSEEERLACIKFFNAAYRAEESGEAGAKKLAEEVERWDPELAACLRLYGAEEGWHRELLEGFLGHVGGGVRPMGWMTGSFYTSYARAERMDSVVLTNLMFETIGATTYRLALRRVAQPLPRQLLKILTRDESFHIPLNVHFLREVLAHAPSRSRLRLRLVYQGVFHALVAMSWGSRRVAQGFDGIPFRELTEAYVENLGRLFAQETDLAFRPPRHLLRSFGVTAERLAQDGPSAISVEAAERAARREHVEVTAL
jgi:hypothetical protein